ncbi:NRDE family protein [Leptobacterium sp. I13]|uniref:NRDE family protein n=1 Tax=Leptobacterium meishanense TaxID=3128904 RepID=UPI0030EB8281
MCTVSYVPFKKGFILTSNRDENPLRKTCEPQQIKLRKGLSVYAPVDTTNGGTWIATDKEKKVACLLNGAFKKHQRNIPYRKSRGLIVTEAFSYNSFSEFIDKIDLQNIEPFTLILKEQENLQVLVWDEKVKHQQQLAIDKSYLWSSATLYTSEEHYRKELFFSRFLQEGQVSPENLLKTHGLYKNTPFILDLPNVKTVSITQIVAEKDNIQLTYDLKKQHKLENIAS